SILTLWDTSEVEVWDSRMLASSLIIHGRFVKSGCEFFIANVYAPCDSIGRQALWLHLGDIINNNKEDNWCVCGDFNAIRSLLERKSRAWVKLMRILLHSISSLMVILSSIDHYVAEFLPGSEAMGHP
ncbi:endonuclease/exonuclease/phosphatase family protein, partial [Medicago truncatula]